MKKKRIKGGGKKLKYKDLDSRLLAWFQERRSPPAESSNSSTLPEKFRREKVTFRRESFGIVWRSNEKIH